MKNILARTVLWMDRYFFYAFVGLMYVGYSILMIMTGGWGFLIWLTSTLLMGIVLGRSKAVNWALKTVANKNNL